MRPGGGVSKPVANSSHQSELGSRKLEGSTKCTTCGNIRELPGSLASVTHRSHNRVRSLEARKETREKAWQIDGWAETVAKVRDSLFPELERLTML